MERRRLVAKWHIPKGMVAKMSASRRRSITHLVFRLPQIIKGSLKLKKTTRPKQRVVFIISTTARLFRFHFYAATLGVVARSSGGIFRFAQLNIFGIHALFFQKRFHGLGAFFG